MSISKVGQYAFYQHPNLERVVVSAPVIEESAFRSCSNLYEVRLTSSNAISIGFYAFNGSSKLNFLILDSNKRATLATTNSIYGTRPYNGYGAICVPDNLLSEYKQAPNWSSIASSIWPLSWHPDNIVDTIDDSWDDIFNNASYATDYKVDDKKTIILTDGTELILDVAGTNIDTKSDGTGKAKITWICHFQIFQHQLAVDDSFTDGWGSCEGRRWLNNEILMLFPQNIRNHIVPVNKTYRIKSPVDETRVSSDYLWVPSYKEIGFTNANYIESDGVVYDLFSDATIGNRKIRYDLNGIAHNYILRTAGRSVSVNEIGRTNQNVTSSEVSYIVFGFCTD